MTHAIREELRSILQGFDELAEQWGDEGKFRRLRDRLRRAVEIAIAPGGPADKMAYAITCRVLEGKTDRNSVEADAVLEYLGIGSPDGLKTVPEWRANYEKMRMGEFDQLIAAREEGGA